MSNPNLESAKPKRHKLRPVEIMPRTSVVDDQLANELLDKWLKLYRRFESDVKQLVQESDGKMVIKMCGTDPLTQLAVQFE